MHRVTIESALQLLHATATNQQQKKKHIITDIHICVCIDNVFVAVKNNSHASVCGTVTSPTRTLAHLQACSV